MTDSQLIFSFYDSHIKHDNFRTGTLICTSPVGNMRFVASSGLEKYQGIGACSIKGRGGIPPCSMVGIQNYTVTTKPISMPTVPGVQGNFYQILPFEVLVGQYGKTVKRGDFGVHADMRVRGTSGCVGIPPGVHWQRFEELMSKIAARGEEKINLFVSAGK